MTKLISFLFLCFTFYSFAQDYKSKMIFNPQTNDQTAVIRMNDYLVFSFDELGKNFKNYNFTVFHCDRNWNRTDLFQSQYLTGYFNDIITERRSSYNALQPYTHYEFQFPNQNITPKFSGNYELIVYEDSENEPLITYHFSMYEELANISVFPERNLNGKNPNLNQQVRVQANIVGFNPNQVINSVELMVMQNNNPNHVIKKLKPQFINSNSFIFNPLEIVFEGTNEFNFFDTKDSRIQGLTTQNVKQNGFFEHTLYMNDPNPTEYAFNPDVNGAYYLRKFDLGIERIASTEGDYVWVLFGLRTPKYENKDVYVVGLFNNYKISDEYKMIYKDGFYELPLFLKQGYYNYQYVTKDAKNQLDYSEINGSFWQTENLYQAFLYVKPWGFNFDSLVGYGEYRLNR